MSSSSSWAHSRLSTILPLDPDSISEILTYTSTLTKPEAAEHLKNLLGDTPQALEFISTYNSRRQDSPSNDPAAREAASAGEGGGIRLSSNADRQNGPEKHNKQRKKKPGLGKLPQPRQIEDAGDTRGAYRKEDISEEYMPSSRMGGDGEGGGSTKFSLTRNNYFPLSSEPVAIAGPVPISITGRNIPTDTSKERSSNKPPPSAQGNLLQDFKNVKMRVASPARTNTSGSSRNASPAPSRATKPAAKVTLQGGKPMHGASTAISDLDAAIRSLEISTNPVLSSSGSGGGDDASSEKAQRDRQCNCVAGRHPLLAAAPNCLSCGKVICVKQGLGPCTFCNSPLLSQQDIQAMIRELRAERGHEKQEANNQSKRRAEVASSSSSPGPTSTAETTHEKHLNQARAHRDRLLAYQAENAQRTTLHDEAADFDADPIRGISPWASPLERAKKLKQQQALLREQEWNARPEYEKRQMVVSLDIDGRTGKARATKKMVGMESPSTVANHTDEDETEKGNLAAENVHYDDDDNDDNNDDLINDDDNDNDNPLTTRKRSPQTKRRTGAFSNNPLLGNLIRPIWKEDDDDASSSPSAKTPNDKKGKEKEEGGKDNPAEPEARSDPPSKWKRRRQHRVVQDDNEDNNNEAYILDGGVYGFQTLDDDENHEGEKGSSRRRRRLGVEEHAFG